MTTRSATPSSSAGPDTAGPSTTMIVGTTPEQSTSALARLPQPSSAAMPSRMSEPVDAITDDEGQPLGQRRCGLRLRRPRRSSTTAARRGSPRRSRRRTRPTRHVAAVDPREQADLGADRGVRAAPQADHGGRRRPMTSAGRRRARLQRPAAPFGCSDRPAERERGRADAHTGLLAGAVGDDVAQHVEQGARRWARRRSPLVRRGRRRGGGSSGTRTTPKRPVADWGTAVAGTIAAPCPSAARMASRRTPSISACGAQLHADASPAARSSTRRSAAPAGGSSRRYVGELGEPHVAGARRGGGRRGRRATQVLGEERLDHELGVVDGEVDDGAATTRPVSTAGMSTDVLPSEMIARTFGWRLPRAP